MSYSLVVRVALAAALVVPALTTATPASAAPRTTVTTEAYAAGQPVPLLKHVYAGWNGSTLTATADATYPRIESRVRGTWETTVKVGRDGHHLLSLHRELSYTDPNPLVTPVEAEYVIEYRWRNVWQRADRITEDWAVSLGGAPAASGETGTIHASVSRSLAGRSVPVRVVIRTWYTGGLVDLQDKWVVLLPGAGTTVLFGPTR